MVNSETVHMEGQSDAKPTRGKGRGSKFCALGHEAWQRLCTAETANRMNFILTYLVLLAGTGSDHRLTKWSAKACEQYLGIGAPRAKRAILELTDAGLVRTTDQATRLSPQYELPVVPTEDEPIFLPLQIVTGLADEVPVLLRVKETGDAMLLQMLVDLYGLVSIDATHGVPIDCLRYGGHEEGVTGTRSVAKVGVHAVWAVSTGSWRAVAGDWTSKHRVTKSAKDGGWGIFWERLERLQQIGAVFLEPWLFESDELDAEPLMPLDPAGLYPVSNPSDEAKLARLAHEAAVALVSEERPYILDSHGDADFFVPLPLHHRPPVLRNVAKLRVEADTPGRRLAWRRRKLLIENHYQRLAQVLHDASQGQFGRPAKRLAKGAAHGASSL